MARDRARTDPLSAESRRQVLRDGLRHVRTPEFIPYDPTPDEVLAIEVIASFGKTLHQMQETMSRAFGKSHALEQNKRLLEGMKVLGQVLDEASISTKDLNLTFPKAKTFTPKRKRIPEKEPYYVKLTKVRRR